jgi:hypothetical protein
MRCRAPALTHSAASSLIFVISRAVLFSCPSKTRALRSRQIVEQTKIERERAPLARVDDEAPASALNQSNIEASEDQW